MRKETGNSNWHGEPLNKAIDAGGECDANTSRRKRGARQVRDSHEGHSVEADRRLSSEERD